MIYFYKVERKTDRSKWETIYFGIHLGDNLKDTKK